MDFSTTDSDLQKVPDRCHMSKAGADTIVTSMLVFLRKPHIVVTFDLNSLVFIAYPCGVSQYMTLGQNSFVRRKLHFSWV